MSIKEKKGIGALFTHILGRKQEASKIPTVEEAIAAWEANKERNPEGYKIVRGSDGKPVEAVLDGKDKDSKTIFAILVNGKKEQFQIGGSMKSLDQACGDLMFQQFINDDVFNEWYEIKGIQLLKAQVGRDNQGFVFGKLGPKPDKLEVNWRGA